MFCPNCGTQLPDGSAFCGNCGNRLSAAPNPAPAPGYPPVAQPAGSFDIKKFLPIIIGVAAAVLLLALFLIIRPFGGGLSGENVGKIMTMEPEKIAKQLDKMESVKVDGQRLYVSSEEFGDLIKDANDGLSKKEAAAADGEWAFAVNPDARDLEDGDDLGNVTCIQVYADTDELTCDKIIGYAKNMGLDVGTYACYVGNGGEYGYLTAYNDDYSINLNVSIDSHATVASATVYTDDGYDLKDAQDEVENYADNLEDEMDEFDYEEIQTNVK